MAIGFHGDPVPPVGNMHLATTIGADIRFTGDQDRASVDTGVAAVADELRSAGRTARLNLGHG